MLATANPKAELRVHPTAGHRFDQPDERGWLVEAVSSFVLGLNNAA